MKEITCIKETCLYSGDLEAMRRFYHGVLNFPVADYQQGRHLFLRAGSSMLLIFNPVDSKQKDSPPAHFGSGPLHLAFEVGVKDYLLIKERLQKKGIEILDEVQWKNSLKSFYFNDPAGNVLEIVPEGVWD